MRHDMQDDCGAGAANLFAGGGSLTLRQLGDARCPLVVSVEHLQIQRLSCTGKHMRTVAAFHRVWTHAMLRVSASGRTSLFLRACAAAKCIRNSTPTGTPTGIACGEHVLKRIHYLQLLVIRKHASCARSRTHKSPA